MSQARWDQGVGVCDKEAGKDREGSLKAGRQDIGSYKPGILLESDLPRSTSTYGLFSLLPTISCPYNLRWLPCAPRTESSPSDAQTAHRLAWLAFVNWLALFFFFFFPLFLCHPLLRLAPELTCACASVPRTSCRKI